MHKSGADVAKTVQLFFAVVILVAAAAWAFKTNETNRSERMKQQRYAEEADNMTLTLQQMMHAKAKATTALAITLAQNGGLAELIGDGAEAKNYFDDYVKKIREQTPYQNVWVELVDGEGKAVYQSWRTETLPKALALPGESGTQASETLFVNRSDLLFAASVPVLSSGHIAGHLRVFMHFNSIAKALQAIGIGMLVTVPPELSGRITDGFSGHEVGDFYIALRDVPETLLHGMSEAQIRAYCRGERIHFHDGNLLVTEQLRDADGAPTGCVMLFRPLDAVETHDISLFAWRNLFLFSLVGAGVLTVFAMIVFEVLRRQRRYYKDILDTSSNIVVVTDGSMILDVNRTFFGYFPQYRDLEEFKRKHRCVCEFFVEEEGFLHRQMEGKNWVAYLLDHPHRRHLAKIMVGGRARIFNVKASCLPHTRPVRTSVIFSEITKEWEDEQELERISLSDPLTGVYNRRYFDSHFSDELSRSRRYGSTLSLIMFDIDHFKRINDIYGHDVGDSVLKQLTASVRQTVRQHDRLCRVGGEEFVIILPNTSLQNAEQFAERIRQEIAQATWERDGRVTISLGVHECRDDESAEAAYAAVDRALYLAKRDGRNCVRSR